MRAVGYESEVLAVLLESCCFEYNVMISLCRNIWVPLQHEHGRHCRSHGRSACPVHVGRAPSLQARSPQHSTQRRSVEDDVDEDDEENKQSNERARGRRDAATGMMSDSSG